ncbi:MAG TPA: phosphoglycerate mutase family protein [Gaiellaceae bacterium]|jgi:phosphohistidine phosphatase|nr:phosphoglycerate mutase family protein [Gaiellaceae bacterium]
MQLLLVRHAEAASGSPDELRPLTAEGRAQARSLGERLRSEGVDPSAILTSPLLRARETGELLAQELDAVTAVDERLAPGATAERVAEAAAERGGTVIAVAHQPDCSQIAAALSGGDEPAFPPAAAMAISLSP